MYNLGDDNELDRVSREAAGRFVPPGEANWQALSDELDKVMPVDKRRRRFLFWWFLPALLAGGAVTYILVPKHNTPVVTNSKQSTPPQADTKAGKTAVPNTVTVDAKKDNTAPVTEAIEKQTAGINTKPAPVTDNAGKQNLAINTKKQTGKKDFAITQEKTNVPAADNGSLVADSKRNAGNSIPGKDKSTEPAKAPPVVSMPAPKADINEPAQNKKDETAKLTTTPAVIVPAATPAKDDAAETAQQATDQLKTPAAAPQIPLKRGKGWSFALLAGVDKSTVKFTYDKNAGLNIGLIAGYHLSDRFSIHTGAIYTQKNYKVAGADFTAPKGSWASYYKLETVEGYCRMFEVPLMARYTVSQGAKSSFFLGAGLSSYFMTRENYDYTYYLPTGPLAVRNTAYNSTDTHILSILHLSTGFEKILADHWSMLIEPYAKIPLGGVGQGNIRLSSFGLNFSLQHRQPSKK